MPRTSKARPIVDESPLARKIGARLRRARLAAGLTQQELAEGRYTKAYVSALENGLSRPSMAALQFFAGRLGLVPGQLINDEPPTWSRLEADLALAAGQWDRALEAYEVLLEMPVQPEQRAERLRGLAEAHARLGHAREAAAAAAEAAHIFHAAGREADAAAAEYWLASAEYQLENSTEARSLLEALLARVRGGLRVEPDFELRLVMAMSSIESREGKHKAAIAYLEEVRGLTESLDDRRRAAYLYDLAVSYRETGDLEAAVRAGTASLELFRRVEAERETAKLEDELARSYLALGNTSRASELAGSARARLVRLDDQWVLSHVLETQAAIALARGDAELAAAAAGEAFRIADSLGNVKGSVDALLALAEADRALGRAEDATQAFERAATLARGSESPGLVRDALGKWADALASAGDHQRAFELMREAMSAG